MAQDSKSVAPATKLNGLFVTGVAMSSTARVFKPDDNDVNTSGEISAFRPCRQLCNAGVRRGKLHRPPPNQDFG